jgi:hypothetical protein
MNNLSNYIDTSALILDIIAAVGIYVYKFKPMPQIEDTYKFELEVSFPSNYDAKRHIETFIDEFNGNVKKRDEINRENDRKAGNYFVVLIFAFLLHGLSIVASFQDSPSGSVPAGEHCCCTNKDNRK